MSDQPLRVAVVGVGSMGRHHARILSHLPEATLVAVVDPNLARATEAVRDWGCAALTDISQLPALDAVILASPTPLHHDMALACLERGFHCFVEKPLAETVSQAEAMIELARRRNRVLQVGHVERFNPAVLEMARRADHPVFIEASRLGPYDPRVSHVGVVLDLMIHDIDIVLALVKEKVVRLEALGARLFDRHEDIAKVTLHFQGGARADLTASRASLKRYRKIRVFQKDAYMSLDYSDRSLTVTRQKHRPLRSLLDIRIERPRLPKTDPLTEELSHFLRCVREGKSPLVDGSHGRDALELALEIRRTMVVHEL